MSSFIDLFEAGTGFFRKAGQLAGGLRQGIGSAASAVGNAVSGAYHDVTGGYNDVVDPNANQPAPQAPAAAPAPQAPAPQAPAPAAQAPAGGPTADAINNFIVQKWGPKYQQLGQELASVKKEAEAFLALPPAAKLQAMGTPAPAAQAPAAAPAPQVAAAPTPAAQAPAPVAAPAPAKPTVGPSNWTPEQIAASQATLNTPQGQAYLQSQKDKANPWGAKSNQAVPATLQQPKASTYVDPDKTIRDARVKKGFADIDAKYAKQRAAKAQGNKAYADVQKELAGMTPAQKRERYKQWDNSKKA